MSKGICTYRAVIFADESALCIVDSFRDTDDYIAVLFKGFLNSFEESFLIKGCFREIDQEWIVTFVFSGKGRGCSEPARMTAHDFYNSNGFFLIDICIYGNFADCRGYISGSTSKAWSVVSMNQVVINGFGLSDNADIAACLGCIPGKLAYSIHGIISANIEKPANVHFSEFLKKSGVNRIFQRFRKLIAAGAQVGTWSSF